MQQLISGITREVWSHSSFIWGLEIKATKEDS